MADDTDPQPGSPSTPKRELVHHLLAGVALLAAVAMMLGLFLVQRVGTTYRDGLEITADGASIAALSATSAESLASDLVDLSTTTGDALDEARDLALVAADTTASLGDAFGTNIADAVTGTSSIADRLADLVEAIERFIPGNRDSLAEDLRTLSTGLEPVPDQLRTLSTQLDAGSTSLVEAADTLATIVTQLDSLTTSIDEARDRLGEVEALSADLGVRAQEALDRSGTDLWLLRLLVAVVGLGVIASAVAARRTLDRLLA